MGNKKMKKITKYEIKDLLSKKKIIETVWNDEQGFNEAIKKLDEAGIDYTVVERRQIIISALKYYLIWALAVDFFQISAIIIAFFMIIGG